MFGFPLTSAGEVATQRPTGLISVFFGFVRSFCEESIYTCQLIVPGQYRFQNVQMGGTVLLEDGLRKHKCLYTQI